MFMKLHKNFGKQSQWGEDSRVQDGQASAKRGKGY